MTESPFCVTDGQTADYGQAVIGNLTSLIDDAVKSADDRRVTELDRLLQLIEKMIEASHTHDMGVWAAARQNVSDQSPTPLSEQPKGAAHQLRI